MADIWIQNYERTKREVLSDLDKASFYEDWQENETWEVGFSVSRTEKNAIVYDMIEHEASVFWKGQEYVIKQMTPAASGNKLTKDVKATHIYYTMQEGYQYEILNGTKSLTESLNHVFAPDNRGFKFVVDNLNGVIGRVEQENFGNGNYLKLVQELLTDYNAVILPDNKYLRFYPRAYYGKKTNNVIRYKYNTDSVVFDIDTFSLKTQIKGSGKKNEDGTYVFPPYTYTSPAAEKWGIRIQDPIEDERYTVAGNLIFRLIKDLHDYPDITGKVELKLPFEVEKGDFIRFIYEPMGINTFIQVVGIRTKPMVTGAPPEITLSNTKKSMTKYLAQMAKIRGR